MPLDLHEAMNMAVDRVDKLDHPLLMIGLGGTGVDMVSTIKRVFQERYNLPKDDHGNTIPVPRRTGYLVIDSDSTALSAFAPSERVNIIVPGLDTILLHLDTALADYEKEWVDPGLDAWNAWSRQAGRLMLSKHYDEISAAISSKLMSMKLDPPHTEWVSVVIVSGICGATGSGTFLDVAQIARHCLAQLPALPGKHCQIVGYLAMPDVSVAHVAGAEESADRLRANGYAALKELDFWMRVDEHKMPYTVQYTPNLASRVTWNHPPFDACTLVCGVSADGTLYKDGYAMMRQTVAESLLHCFACESTSIGTLPRSFCLLLGVPLPLALAPLPKTYPVFYGYRAIGAYSKGVPKAEIMFYEGRKLLETFVPACDPQGKLVPNTDLLQDGQNAVCACQLVGTLSDLMNNVANHVQLPKFLDMNSSELAKLMPVPHERADYASPTRWKTDDLPPAMEKEAEAFLANAWNAFTNLARNVMTDPQQGPFSLKAYLEDPSEAGLMAALEGIRTQWKAKWRDLPQTTAAQLSLCASKFPAFQHPPLLGRQRAIDEYTNALRRYYNLVRAGAFLNAFLPALDKLIMRIWEYRAQALTPLCKDLLAFYEMAGQPLPEEERASTIYDLADVRDQIDNTYQTGNVDHQFERKLLGELCDASLETRPNVDVPSSGVNFPFHTSHEERLYSALRRVVNECFGNATDISLDAIVQLHAGDDVAERNNYMDELLQTVLYNSVPLFMQNRTYQNEPKASFRFFSVPDTAPDIIARASSLKLEPEASTINDHIHCITMWDGLPLYRYDYMRKMATSYESCLNNTQARMGLHLVYHPYAQQVDSNWQLLPEPCPYYLFGETPSPREKLAFERTRDLVNRAIACGLVEVNDTTDRPTFTLKLRYEDAKRVTFQSTERMKADIDRLQEEKDPVTGHPIQPADLLKRLSDYINNDPSIGSVVVRSEQSPSVMAPILGLESQPIDPWNPHVAGNPSQLAVAKANYKTLCQAMAAAQLSRYPNYMDGIALQVEAVEYAVEKMAAIGRKQNAWQPRIAFASQFAKLYIFGAFKTGGLCGYKYENLAGESQNVIENHLLAEDLVGELPMLKHAAYLADLAPDNAMRQALVEKANELEAELVTKADLEEVIKQAAALEAKATEERNKYLANRKTPGADRERIEKISQLFQVIIDTAESTKSQYEEAVNELRMG